MFDAVLVKTLVSASAFFLAATSSTTSRGPTTTTTPTSTRGNSNSNNNGKYDPILDWKPPSQEQIRQTRRQIIEPMKALTSPIFISTNPNTGQRHQSLKYVIDAATTTTAQQQQHYERRSPILFVSNHQLLGFDSFLVVNELMEACSSNDNDNNMFVRPLTHPFLSTIIDNGGGSKDGDSSSYDDDFTLPGGTFLETYGCLPATPKTFYNCMKYNQACLLFPGGAKESFHKSQEQYTLKAWSDTLDFVRIAAKYNATIIPFSSVGAAESAIFLDQIKVPSSLPLPLPL